MGSWLGIDHGTKRIGVAVGDTLTGIASPVEIITDSTELMALERIAALAGEYGVDGVVFGWPLNMDSTEGDQGKIVREFAKTLVDRTGLDVRLWDERLSSFAADQALAGTFTRKKRKARQDAIAASYILQDFFRSHGPTNAPQPHEAQAEQE
ncbi:MAG: Holliday junction resolvase RuvX [Phycisphaerae bacterium]